MANHALVDNELMMPDADGNAAAITLCHFHCLSHTTEKSRRARDGNLHVAARGTDTGLGSTDEQRNLHLRQHHCVTNTDYQGLWRPTYSSFMSK